MPIILARIDDRLIHGQVVIGWGTYLHPDRILLCSDRVAASEWERDIYLGDLTEDIEAEVLSVEETASNLSEHQYGDEKLILLVESPSVVVALLDHGLHLTTVNIGGMHYVEGKRRIASFIYVDDEDVRWFQELHRRGVALEGQDVPTSKKIDVAKLLKFPKE